ncbi:MAG: hypothetical protein M3P33_03270, partial [bacterium]|nr:hypothetical protein [bacterium]
QCFKVLTEPNTIGGPILLLTDPVGRQEQDNLNYLERFNFMPTQEDHEILNDALTNNNTDQILKFVAKAHHWRALKLPTDPRRATQFITKSLKVGLFQAMQNYKGYTKTPELSPNGVKQIWDTLLPAPPSLP